MSLGIAVETVGYLILAVLAIVILFIVLSMFAPKIAPFISQTFNSFITFLCKRLPNGVSNLCGLATGS